MNLFDVLFMQKTGKIKPGADLFDIMFAKVTGAIGRLVTIIGNPLSFLAKKAQTAKSTKVTLSPVQAGSGDPSPTNIRPISGRSSMEIKGCGKNLVNTDDMAKYVITDAAEERWGLKYDFPGTFVLKVFTSPSSNSYIFARKINSDGTFSDVEKVTNAKNTYVITITVNQGESLCVYNGLSYGTKSTTVTTFNNLQLSVTLGATEPIAYESYQQSNDVTITFPAVGKNLFDYDESKVSVCETSTETVRSYYPTGITNCTITFSAYLIDSESVTNTFINVGKLVDGKLYVLGSFLSTNGSITNRTVTLAEGEEAVLMSAVSETSGITSNLPKYNIQLELGSSATTYEPYTNTVYGGTLDVETGVVTVDKGYVDLGSVEWETAPSGRHNTNKIPNIKYALNTELINAISSVYKVIKGNNIHNIDMSFAALNVSSIQINDSRYNGDDATTFKTAMSGVQLVYELATPRTIQLTPSQIQILKGQNTIWIEDEGVVMELGYMN